MPSTWKFVDTPVTTPATLLDLNDGTVWKTLREGLDVSPPDLRRSIVGNQMIDGGYLTAASYDLRTLKFSLHLYGASEDARNSQLKNLEAELNKPTNLIMYQATSSSYPVYFRTLRSDTFDLDKQFIPGQAWQIDCEVLAEPFAIGIRRDLTQVTITNDPASGTNKQFWDITGIVGDSPTPAFMRISDLGANGLIWLGTKAFGNPTSLTLFAQAESGTLGTNTTSSAVTGFSGGNGAVCTFGTNTLIDRTTLTLPTSSDATALRGRYRVILRCSASATQNTTLRVVQAPAGPDTVPARKVTVDLTTTAVLVDLGVIETPPPQPVPQYVGYSGLAAAYATKTFSVQAIRNTGSGNLQMDYVYLLPADERLCAVSQVAGISSGYVCLDGPNDATYGMASGTTPFGSTRTIDNNGGLVPRIGGLPYLVPGVTNRWHMLKSGAITDTRTVDVSYWPRWREVATS
jgi:hypothetical protein